jgi:hypothetical protein
VKITVIATGFAPAGERRPVSKPIQLATAAALPAAVATRAVPPPPVPAQRAVEPVVPRAKPIPAAVPATVKAGAGRALPGFSLENDDQFDIPAFLRRKGGREER